MFSMFSQTGATQKDKKFAAIVVCNCSTGHQQNVDDDYCACRPRQCRVKAVGGDVTGYSFIMGPHIFLNRGPAWSESGPAQKYW